MTDTKNDPITLELPGYVVDILADWLRADGVAMHPATAQPEKKGARENRRELGDTFARAVQHVMPFAIAAGDLADALNERAEAYEAYRVDQRRKEQSRGTVEMIEPSEKDRRLADLHERLGEPVTPESLEGWNQELRAEVDRMKTDGLIDPEEAHELREFIDAAYSHHAEEGHSRELNQ